MPLGKFPAFWAQQCWPPSNLRHRSEGTNTAQVHISTTLLTSHMASDAPQPHITGLEKHHATLSKNTSKLKHLSFSRGSTLSVVRECCGAVKGHLSFTPAKKSQPLEILVCGLVCLGFRWLGLEVQQNKRRSRKACDTEDTAQSSLLPWLTSDIPQWRVRGQIVGWLNATPVEHLLTPECEFTFSKQDYLWLVSLSEP